MKIVADEWMAGALTEVFADVADKNVAVVQMELIFEGKSLRSDLHGLDEAIKLAADGMPVVLLSVMGEHAHRHEADNKRWHAMLAYTHVLYRDGIASPADLRGSVDQALALPMGVRDPLAIRLLEVVDVEDELRSLAHDRGHAERQGPEAMERWFIRARKTCTKLTDEAILELVKSRSAEALPEGPLTGESFPDVCVDVEGTLLDQAGNLRQDVVDRVKAEAGDGPITIWTGGDMRDLSKKIRTAGLTWKMVSKYQMRGATVAVVIDDLPQAEFTTRYGITAQTYIQV